MVDPLVLGCPVPARGREHVPRQLVRAHGILEPESLVSGQGPREPKGPLVLLSTIHTHIASHNATFPSRRHPRVRGPLVLPRSPGHGDGVRGQQALQEVEDGQHARAQAAVGVILVDLVGRALAQGGDYVIDGQQGRVGDGVEGPRGEVHEEQQALVGQELEHLAELVRVAGHARVVAELALPPARRRRVQRQEVPRDRGEGVQEGVAPVLELFWIGGGEERG